MMFLIRMAFWVSVVLVLLPSGKKDEVSSAAHAQLSATDAAAAAASTVADMRQFCERRPDACAVGAQAAVAFGERAQAGARMVYEFLSEKASTGGKTPTSRTETAKAGDTLTADDRMPTWRNPARKEQRIPPA